jgi:aminoglycoside 3-N-acetyltransferase
MPLTAGEFVGSLRELGLRPGDSLLCHSSYKSFRAGVDGGPAAVGQALVDAVGPGGSAFVPTFNYGMLPWDVRTTASLTGAVTDFFWRRPDAVRSDHPTHAVAGVGPVAAGVLAHHATDLPFGPDSPIGQLWRENAWVLLIGVDHTTNSTIHIAEALLDLPYLRRSRSALVVRGGSTEPITVRRPPCSNGFNVVDAPLRAAAQIREGFAGGSRLLLMRSRDLVGAAQDLLGQDSAALLCPQGTCDFCDASRRMLSDASP